MNFIFGIVLLFSVIAFIIIRPRGINVAWPAGIGAIIAISLGLIPISILDTIFSNTWNACVTLISLFIFSNALDSNKFFDWAAYRLSLKAAGSGRKMFIYILLLTAVATSLLANDGAILILTPIIATLLNSIYPGNLKIHLPFIFAAGFFADSMSIALLPANLTNIILADSNHLMFGGFMLYMLLPTICAFVAGAFCFGLRFRKELNITYAQASLINPKTIVRDRLTFWIGWIALVTMVAGYIIGGQFHIPVAFIILPISIAMLITVDARKLISAKEIISEAPWSILVFAIGMFIVITSAYNVGALDIVIDPLKPLIASPQPNDVFIAGSIYSLLAAALNNLPAALIGVLSSHATQHLSQFAVYMTIIAVDIGQKLTPFGSLSTLLWLGILRRHNVNISWDLYIKENWWIAIVTFIAACCGLFLSSVIFGY